MSGLWTHYSIHIAAGRITHCENARVYKETTFPFPWFPVNEGRREKGTKIEKHRKNCTWYTGYIHVWRLRGGTPGSASRRSRRPSSQHIPRASDHKPLSTSHEIRSFDESRHCTPIHFMAHGSVHKRCFEEKHLTLVSEISTIAYEKTDHQKSFVPSPSVGKEGTWTETLGNSVARTTR